MFLMFKSKAGHVQAEARAGGRAEASGDALAQTRALAATLAADKDGKFANSRFLQFVSKMSRGEIVLENNEARPDECRPEFGE